MRKITILSLAILLTTFCIYTGCKKQSSTTTPNLTTAALTSGDASIISTYSVVGTMHNAGMDFIYNDFVALKASMPEWILTKDQVFNYTNQYACDYIDTLWNLTDSQYNAVLTSTKNFNNYFYYNNTAYTVSAASAHCTTTFSNALQNALTIMISIGDSSFSDSTKYAMWDTLLNQRIGLMANYNEKCALAAGITTAKASYQYWENTDNVNKWSELWAGITEGKTTKKTSDTGHWVADAIGAATGAVQYGSQGAVFGPGGAIVAGVAGAVAGACSATGISVITNFIASWFD